MLATISRINDSRNFVDADIDVPAGGRSALLTFSRPYFRGYKARIGDQKLAITSYRGLFPILEIPAGTHGRLTVAYRPTWLLWGGGVAAVCGLIVAARRCRRVALLFFESNGILPLISYDKRGAQSSFGSSSNSITRLSKRPPPPPSKLR